MAPGRAGADERILLDTAPEGADRPFAIGPEVGLVMPVARTPVCPSGAECLLGVGFAFGIPFTYRWKQGTGIGFEYEFWVLNGNAVYEATVTQAFTAIVRQSFLVDRRLRPVLRLRGGFLILGPSFGANTIGGVGEAAFGGETDIAPTSVFHFLLGAQLFGTRPFTTSADGVARAQSGGINAALVLRVGISFLL
ncbi:MAG: hypothetical protein WBG86_10255 [Polyangiales bacterium]